MDKKTKNKKAKRQKDKKTKRQKDKKTKRQKDKKTKRHIGKKPKRELIFLMSGQFCNALRGKLFRKLKIGKFTKMINISPLIFCRCDYFRENIWRLSSAHVHFCYRFGDKLNQFQFRGGRK